VPQLEIHPVTPDRWDDLVDLFGPNGAYSGCWCMWPRQSAADFDLHHGEDNRRSLRAIVTDRVAGLLAYENDSPVGWVAVGPREEYGRIQRSRITKPVDDEGIGSALLNAAVTYADSQGATAVEGYPLDKERAANSDAWWGLAPMFLEAGFKEIARRSPARPLMRKTL
jgi:GNAT superfamily N-acetyltransferase